jgi:hypothetical protein
MPISLVNPNSARFWQFGNEEPTFQIACVNTISNTATVTPAQIFSNREQTQIFKPTIVSSGLVTTYNYTFIFPANYAPSFIALVSANTAGTVASTTSYRAVLSTITYPFAAVATSVSRSVTFTMTLGI